MLDARLLQSVARRLGAWISANVVALQLAVKRGAADAEHASRESLIALDLLEDALNGCTFDVFQIGCGKRSSSRASSGIQFGRGRKIGNQFSRGFGGCP